LYFRTMSCWPIVMFFKILYNSDMLKDSKNPFTSQNVEKDPRLFMWFLTMVMVIMYAVSLSQKPELRQSWQLVIFTFLMAMHIVFHWQNEKAMKKPKWTIAYIILQGVIGFVICWMAANEGIIIGVFMALFGEVIGMLGLSRAALIAALYYLALAYFNLRNIMNVGSTSWMLIGVIPVIIFVVIYVILYRRQTDAREQAQALAAELEKANQQLSQYAAQVEDLTIANERQRMARELHDTLSQGLTGIILQLEATDAHLANNRIERARSIVSSAMEQARNTLADARNAIDDLRRNQTNNLETALRMEMTHFQHATDIPCEIEVNENSEISEKIRETIVRNVSEALTNIGKHAQAKHVFVRVTEEMDELIVLVEDDGKGFDPQTIPSGHYGLLGMHERMRQSGGKLQIISNLGGGTRLEMRIPV